MDDKKALHQFLDQQKCLAVGTHGDAPWIANLYHSVDDDLNIYFISGEGEMHSQHILKNPTVTFATAWHNEENHADRKGVQGRGVCRMATDDADIEKEVALRNARFPEFKERLTPDYIRSNDNQARVWVITPGRIKFWNDELYGSEYWKEFRF